MPRILIVSGDVVDYFMGGVGVRYWCIANALSEYCDVILAVPNKTELAPEKFQIIPFNLQKDNIQHLTSGVDVIVTHGFVLHFHPYLRDLSIPIAIDLYVPYLLESLVWHDQDNWSEWIPAYEEYLRVQLELLRVGDFFFCASERQRDYWLGWLHAQKRINPHTFRYDPTLRKLIDVVPFGLPEGDIQPTRAVLKGIHPNIALNDKLILWSGGLWDWLDPITLINAVYALVPRYPNLKLYFMGTIHPNVDVNNMVMPANAIEFCRQLGLLDKNIFFGDWVSYFERENYLAEADLAVIAHPDHIETHFSFRTRVLDAIWAEIPIIITDGDDFASEVIQHKIGLVIPQEDVEAMALAIEQALFKDRLNVKQNNFTNLKTKLRWSNIISPLLDFCIQPVRMVDKDQYLTELERISRDKERYYVSILQERELDFLQKIQAQEIEFINKLEQQDAVNKSLLVEKKVEIERLIRSNELIIAEIIQTKEKEVQDIIKTKDQQLLQELSQKDKEFSRVIQEKDIEFEKISQKLTIYENLLPYVSVIIVNFNGKHYLCDCLNALRLQTYPQHRFEIIVSDNGSTDGSLQLLQEAYPWVRVLSNQENLGFAKGNNVALKEAKGEYLILLNNDTAVTPGWLEGMVKVAVAHPEAGLVTGRLQLFYDQLALKIQSETFTPNKDQRELGVQIFEFDPNLPGGVVQYLDGFYGWENYAQEERFRWTKGEALLGIPVPLQSGDWKISLRLAASRIIEESVKVKIEVDGMNPVELTVCGGTPVNYEILIPETVKNFATSLVQNTGSIIFSNGSGRDRGTYVKDFEVFYESDRGQYSQIEEVFSGCGANLLLRRKLVDEIGFFDDDFFMYYEDTDLSWRARLKGWKVLYAPEAIVKHIHCGSSGEWSPFFLYHVDRNRLAMILKNGGWNQVFWNWGSYFYRAMKEALGLVLLRKKYSADFLKLRLRVIAHLILWIPSLLLKRWKIQRSRKIDPGEIAEWFV